MGNISNDDKHRESLSLEKQSAVAGKIGICAWCKDQVPPDRDMEHAAQCALIPEDEKARILQQKTGAVETLNVDNLQK